MESKTTAEFSIYYIVQGRAIDGDTNYIEHTFTDINPLEARERAFSYLKYYVQLLHQGKKIFFKQKEKIVNEEILLENINKYTISFAENNFGLDGIAIFMVINQRTNKHNDFFESNEERHLIYSVQNLSKDNVENIKRALIKEFRYYNQLNISTSKFQDELTLKDNLESESFFNNEVVYKILKTPIDFYFIALKTYQSHLFTEQVKIDFEAIDLKTTTFISKLDWHTIRIHIASFLNTDGGRIYLGKFVKNQIINCLDTNNIAICKQLLNKNVSKHFPKQKYLLTFKFVKINKILVPIIEVKVSNRMFSFYNIAENNNFYIRTKNGLQTIQETEKIAEYVMNNSEIRLSDLSELLDLL